MYKKFLFTTLTVSAFLLMGAAYNASAEEMAAASHAEDEKYTQAYDECTKENDANKENQDELFAACMENKGFPQEAGEQSEEGAESN